MQEPFALRTDPAGGVGTLSKELRGGFIQTFLYRNPIVLRGRS